MQITKWDNSASVFVSAGQQVRQVNNLAGGRDVAFFNYSTALILDQNDYIKIQVSNESGANDITIENNSSYRLEHR